MSYFVVFQNASNTLPLQVLHSILEFKIQYHYHVVRLVLEVKPNLWIINIVFKEKICDSFQF